MVSYATTHGMQLADINMYIILLHIRTYIHVYYNQCKYVRMRVQSQSILQLHYNALRCRLLA